MNFQTMHKQRRMILIAAAIGLIATFLPWFRLSVFGFSQSVNGWHGVGFMAIAGFALAGAVAVMGIQTAALNTTSWFLAIAGGALALLGAILFWSDIPSDVPSGMGGTSIGLYLALIAGAGVCAFAWMHRTPGTTLRDGFDAVKRDVNDRTGSGPTPPPPPPSGGSQL